MGSGLVLSSCHLLALGLTFCLPSLDMNKGSLPVASMDASSHTAISFFEIKPLTPGRHGDSDVSVRDAGQPKGAENVFPDSQRECEDDVERESLEKEDVECQSQALDHVPDSPLNSGGSSSHAGSRNASGCSKLLAVASCVLEGSPGVEVGLSLASQCCFLNSWVPTHKDQHLGCVGRNETWFLRFNSGFKKLQSQGTKSEKKF